MSSTKHQIIDTWQINNHANLLLLDNIDTEGLSATLSTRGGRTIAQQFAHLHNVRLEWLKVSANDLLSKQTKIDPKISLTRLILKSRLTESGDAVAVMLERAVENGKVKGFKRGPIPMLGYLIAHDAHHRGSILLTLKQSGHPVPQEVRDGIWNWGNRGAL
jgi:uncharacterized damage-inducible protein DinB